MKIKNVVFLLFFFTTQSVLADITCDTDISDLYAVYEPNTYNCPSGYYLPANTDGCQICNVFGKSCPGGTYTFNETTDQGLAIGTYSCNSGYYLPANTDECVACTYGHTCSGGTYTFNETTDQGITNASYTCSAGQYLPANTDGCRTCPTGFTCPGGTFVFNENEFQGASGTITTNTMNNICAVNFSSDLYAVYEPNSHTCSAGYYLPANIDECTVCPSHTVCAGGTYTFSETTTQGITGCESGYNLQNNVCVGNIITINWSDADALDISANNAGTMTYGGDIRTPRAAIDKTNIGLRFKGWKFTPNPQ